MARLSIAVWPPSEVAAILSTDRSAYEASNPFAGWSLHGISIAVWNYGRTRPATPKPHR